MAERKKTPNILADLLGDQPPHPKETLSQQAVLTAKQQNSKTVVPESLADTIEENGPDEATAKIKVTFYLSEDSVDLLEQAQLTLRRMSRSNNKISKSTTSKSALLEEALKLACADLEEKGEKSQFARLLF